eukprot:CAMPEP_0201739000 /NCGR_PEP_ID=MMETSP0593-20130828/45545_1 /ASSEMBLY_ACC=CAM_ASM_000672 /TAXON_ID=267983 /ORGANISM="Skeletonema japonicum, Strain CCMP2506" /LENGTH=808 /DNA_ID=CAMNT_0048233237 /DNA_START=44 /DNA_END=2469 /DNA_ORIENTATION=-
MTTQQRPAAAATQSSDNNNNSNMFNDVGIVYRDHKILLDDQEGAPIIQPLSISIDDDIRSTNDHHHQQQPAEDDFYDEDSESSGFTSFQRDPSYTPQIYIRQPHLAALPVLLLEFLALALTRAVLPSLLLKRYGSRTYIIMGGAECVRGIFAFFACPLFGKLSDVWGRRPCLFVTVLGTLAPVCSLAFWKPQGGGGYYDQSHDVVTADMDMASQNNMEAFGVDAGDASPEGSSWILLSGMDYSDQLLSTINILPTLHRIDLFVILFALSGVFASTFTLSAVRGIFAFFACPLFGKLSDVWGRRPCLFVTVLGTLAPVCSLAFWKPQGGGGYYDQSHDVDTADMDMTSQNNMEALEAGHILDGVDAGDASPEGSSWILLSGMDYSDQLLSTINILPTLHRIDLFVILFALSGVFASTFTLTFAYISDVVKDRDGRVSAYGLALATFGLSFTVGPLLGGYLANVDDEGKGQGGRSFLKFLNTDDNESSSTSEHYEHSSGEIHPIGQHRVFVMTLVLAVLDLFYIYFILPESLKHNKRNELENYSVSESASSEPGEMSTTAIADNSSSSSNLFHGGVGVSRRASSSWWNPFDSIRYLTTDPLLSKIGHITILYYTALHAVVSTLILYAARQFHLGPERLGELMAALGLSTMLSEAILVRIVIPSLGEPSSMRLGLMSFTLQCILLALAGSPWQLFFCAVLAIPGNLVYPSITSLVSTSVKPEMVGRALGSINGVKSLTEGVGPLIFGTLLTISETHSLPGWPYFIAAIMSALAWRATKDLPGEPNERAEYHMARNTVDYEEMEPFNERNKA